MTADDDIPVAAAELLVEHVNTLEKLELLVEVMTGSQITWGLDAICAALQISPVHLRPHLDELRACGLLRLIPGRAFRFRFEPTTKAIGAAANALVGAYRRNRGAVLGLLRQASVERARRSPADAFAEAFVVRKRAIEDSDD